MTLWQFLFDVLIFHVVYTFIQYIGLGLLFSLYIFQGLKYLLFDLPRNRKREQLKLEELQKVDEIVFGGEHGARSVAMSNFSKRFLGSQNEPLVSVTEEDSSKENKSSLKETDGDDPNRATLMISVDQALIEGA